MGEERTPVEMKVGERIRELRETKALSLRPPDFPLPRDAHQDIEGPGR